MLDAVTLGCRWYRQYVPCDGAVSEYVLIEMEGANSADDLNVASNADDLNVTSNVDDLNVASNADAPTPAHAPGDVAHAKRRIYPLRNLCLKLTAVDHTNIIAVNGGDVFKNSNFSIATVNMGDLSVGETKQLLVQLELGIHPLGVHSVLELEWNCESGTATTVYFSGNRTITANFTNNVKFLQEPTDKYVERLIQLTQTATTIDQARLAFQRGDTETGRAILQQQADQLLKLAVMTDDVTLRTMLKNLYESLEQYDDTLE